MKSQIILSVFTAVTLLSAGVFAAEDTLTETSGAIITIKKPFSMAKNSPAGFQNGRLLKTTADGDLIGLDPKAPWFMITRNRASFGESAPGVDFKKGDTYILSFSSSMLNWKNHTNSTYAGIRGTGATPPLKLENFVVPNASGTLTIPYFDMDRASDRATVPDFEQCVGDWMEIDASNAK